MHLWLLLWLPHADQRTAKWQASSLVKHTSQRAGCVWGGVWNFVPAKRAPIRPLACDCPGTSTLLKAHHEYKCVPMSGRLLAQQCCSTRMEYLRSFATAGASLHAPWHHSTPFNWSCIAEIGHTCKGRLLMLQDCCCLLLVRLGLLLLCTTAQSATTATAAVGTCAAATAAAGVGAVGNTGGAAAAGSAQLRCCLALLLQLPLLVWMLTGHRSRSMHPRRHSQSLSCSLHGSCS